MSKIDSEAVFELVHKIGEGDSENYHIIDQTDPYPEHDECRNYRVYHKNGNCFDTWKEIEQMDDENDIVTKWYFGFSQEWEGFKKLTTTEQIKKLLK